MIYFILIVHLSLLIESGWEAVYGDKHGKMSNIVLGGIILGMFFIGYWTHGFKFGAAAYLAYRFTGFDYMFSIWRYGKPTYMGKTSVTDKAYHKVILKIATFITKKTLKIKKIVEDHHVMIFDKIHISTKKVVGYGLFFIRIIVFVCLTIYLIRL